MKRAYDYASLVERAKRGTILEALLRSDTSKIIFVENFKLERLQGKAYDGRIYSVSGTTVRVTDTPNEFPVSVYGTGRSTKRAISILEKTTRIKLRLRKSSRSPLQFGVRISEVLKNRTVLYAVDFSPRFLTRVRFS